MHHIPEARAFDGCDRPHIHRQVVHDAVGEELTKWRFQVDFLDVSRCREVGSDGPARRRSHLAQWRHNFHRMRKSKVSSQFCRLFEIWDALPATMNRAEDDFFVIRVNVMFVFRFEPEKPTLSISLQVTARILPQSFLTIIV